MAISEIELKLYKFGLVLLVLTFPLANRDLFSIYYPKLFPSRIILVVLLGIGFLSLLGRAAAERSLRFLWRGFWDDHVLRVLMALFLVRAVSLVNSLNLAASLSLLSFYAAMVGLYLLLRFLAAKDFSFLRRLFKIHLGAAIVIGFYGFVQAILPLFGIVLPGVLLGGTFIRVPATFYDANHLPPYILSALPFILVLGWLSKRSAWRGFFFLTAALLSLVVFLSFSRSGIFGFGVSVLVLLSLFVWYRRWRKVGLILSLLLPLFLVVVLSSRTQFSFTKRALSVFSPAEKSTMAHTALLYGEFKLFLQHPLLGVGYGSFSEHFRRSKIGAEHAQFDPATGVRIPPHSLWLETLTETGLLGFVLYFSLMLIVLESLVKALRKVSSEEYRLKVAALLAGFFGILSAGIFYSYNLSFFWFFIFFALLFARHLLLSKDPALFVETAEREKIDWGEMAPLVFLVCFSAAFIFFRLGFGDITDESAAFNAVVAKNILRTFQVRGKDFWILRRRFGGEPWLGQPPLFFYLGAFMMFFYDVTNFSARFFSAFFGLGSVVLTYLLGKRLLGKRAGFLAGLLLTALPSYLRISRAGTMDAAYLFFALALFQLFLRARANGVFWVFFGFVFGLVFLLDQRFSAMLVLFLLILLAADIWRSKTFRLYKNLFFVISPAVAAAVALPWYSVMYRRFGADLICALRRFGYGSLWGDLRPWGFPLAALLLARLLKRVAGARFFRKEFLLTVVVFLFVSSSFNWVASLPVPKYEKELRLIAARHELSRAGTVPIIVSAPIAPTFLYYSDIPIKRLDERELLEEFRKVKAKFSAIIDGEQFRRIRRGLVGWDVGTKVIDSAENLVLVQKW